MISFLLELPVPLAYLDIKELKVQTHLLRALESA
jgi:hypothetical protein